MLNPGLPGRCLCTAQVNDRHSTQHCQASKRTKQPAANRHDLLQCLRPCSCWDRVTIARTLAAGNANNSAHWRGRTMMLIASATTCSSTSLHQRPSAAPKAYYCTEKVEATCHTTTTTKQRQRYPSPARNVAHVVAADHLLEQLLARPEALLVQGNVRVATRHVLTCTFG